MKCLVFSDSHGEYQYIKKALSLHPDAEVVFFLGDGLSVIDEIAKGEDKRMWVCVRGNCDFCSIFLNNDVAVSEEITLMGKKIFLTHGHMYSVKSGLDLISSAAEFRGADIVLFGHTHKPHLSYVSSDVHPYYLFNPGSIKEFPYNYGILTITENATLFSHGCFRI